MQLETCMQLLQENNYFLQIVISGPCAHKYYFKLYIRQKKYM